MKRAGTERSKAGWARVAIESLDICTEFGGCYIAKIDSSAGFEVILKITFENPPSCMWN